jgi:chromate transporter
MICLLFELFITFFIIGFISFGGGYSIIPVIETEAISHGWMTTQEFTDIIAIAGMSPGPIATNSAILVGYSQAGIIGAIVATLGIVFPSFILIIIIAMFFKKLYKYRLVEAAFYGLRPIVLGLIFYSAIKFALANQVVSLTISSQSIILLVVFGLSLAALVKFKLHPMFVILLSGGVGVLVFS